MHKLSLSLLSPLAMALAISSCGPTAPDAAVTKADQTESAFVPTAEQKHAVEVMNQYRAGKGVGPLVIDEKLSAFAREGSEELADGGQPHEHFGNAGSSLWQKGFCGQAAENQAPGWYGKPDAELIDGILKAMMDEGPGGGHHDNIMNAKLTRVGVGLVKKGGKLYFTTDHSGSCG